MISKSSIYPICYHDAKLIFLSHFWVGRSLHGANQASQEDLLGFNQVLIKIRAPYSPNFSVKIDIRGCFGEKKNKEDRFEIFKIFRAQIAECARILWASPSPNPLREYTPRVSQEWAIWDPQSVLSRKVWATRFQKKLLIFSLVIVILIRVSSISKDSYLY